MRRTPNESGARVESDTSLHSGETAKRIIPNACTKHKHLKRYRQPTHVSVVLDDVLDAILQNVVMDNGQPPTPDEAVILKQRWLCAGPDDGEVAE